MVFTNTSHIAAVPYVRFGTELKYEAGNWDIHRCWGQEINGGPTLMVGQHFPGFCGQIMNRPMVFGH